MSKVKTNFYDIKAIAKRVKKAIPSIAKSELKTAIVDKSILLGISPVEGEGKFQRYSKSYRDAIIAGRYKKYGKNILPVNLKLSGETLDTFFVRPVAEGLEVGFDSDLAEIHTVKGAGRSKVIRKMLPVGDGEVFKRSIQQVILDLVNKAVDRILGK